MVVSMSDSWGTESVSDGGKVVWFTLRADAPAPRRALAVPLSALVREAIRRAPHPMASAPARKPVRDQEQQPVRERVREIALV
jgi:hypothetical protein